jgi:hypothetical protein
MARLGKTGESHRLAFRDLLLHLRTHEIWSLGMGTWLSGGNDPRYTPTTYFRTFPQPLPPGTEPKDDPRVLAIAHAAARLDEQRRAWLDPAGTSEADLKQRTLTNLYNQRPTWLQNAHAGLDRAVWDAYGWDDPVPGDVEEDTILARLLLLNQERARQHCEASAPLAYEVGDMQATWRARLKPTRNLTAAALFLGEYGHAHS